MVAEKAKKDVATAAKLNKGFFFLLSLFPITWDFFFPALRVLQFLFWFLRYLKWGNKKKMREMVTKAAARCPGASKHG